jgi:hypothetical protein
MIAARTATTASLLVLFLQGCLPASHQPQAKSCIYGDCVEGLGIERDSKGLYIGDWRNGERSETGSYDNYFLGSRYLGRWEEGKPNGAGTLFLGSGSITGNWLDGAPDGEMTYAGQDGTFRGTMGKGGYQLPYLFLEEGELSWPSGEKYRGSFGGTPSSDLPEGAGEYVRSNGERIQGNFKTLRKPTLFGSNCPGEVVTGLGTARYAVQEKGPGSLIPFKFKEFGSVKRALEKKAP